MVVCRGQFAASIRFLAKRWRWGERKVRNFLAFIRRQELATVECPQGINIITIVHYDEYSGNSGTDTASDTIKDTIGDTTISQVTNNLLKSKTQQKTQQRTQLETHPAEIAEKVQDSGHKGDTKPNKEEERYKEENSIEFSEKAADAAFSPARPKIDFEAIKTDFNSRFAGVLPRIQVMSAQRMSAVRARIAEFGEDSVARVFDNVAASKFLRGENERGWKADFDWIFKPAKYVRILEGNYADNYGQKIKRRFGDHDPSEYIGQGLTDI